MQKLTLFLLSFSFAISGFSQTDSVGYFGDTYIKSDNDVKGSRFLFDNWESGEITLKSNEKILMENMNLDASRGVFMCKKNDSLYEVPNNVKEIRIFAKDHSSDSASGMIFRNDVNPAAANFVEVLEQGKITIFCIYNKKPEGENATNGFVTTNRKYELNTDYYSLSNNKATLIKFTSSNLHDLTSDKKDKVDAFVKENKLKVKKEPDFIKAIKYYNSISG